MKARATLFGHPIHQMLIVFPLGLLATSVVFDIVHLATGWNAGQLKVGSFARSERLAKWNEGIRVETRPDPPAGFAGGTALARGR